MSVKISKISQICPKISKFADFLLFANLVNIKFDRYFVIFSLLVQAEGLEPLKS
jgi:hypothetical protein